MQLGHPDWWDSNSDQPYKLPSGSKNRTSSAHVNEYSKTLLSTVAIFPLLCYQLLRPQKNNKERAKKILLDWEFLMIVEIQTKS